MQSVQSRYDERCRAEYAVIEAFFARTWMDSAAGVMPTARVGIGGVLKTGQYSLAVTDRERGMGVLS
jgi:hypothetical protein